MGGPFSGRMKYELCQRLGFSWNDLADVLDVPTSDRRRFQDGRECQDLWNWLEERKRLKELPGALRFIKREDLAQLLEESRKQVTSQQNTPKRLPENTSLANAHQEKVSLYGGESADLTALVSATEAEPGPARRHQGGGDVCPDESSRGGHHRPARRCGRVAKPNPPKDHRGTGRQAHGSGRPTGRSHRLSHRRVAVTSKLFQGHPGMEPGVSAGTGVSL